MTLNCPNCGSPLTQIDEDTYVCRHCNSTVKAADSTTDLRIVDISDDPRNEFVMICQECVESKRYRDLGRYADHILDIDNGDCRGLYYRSMFLMANGSENFDGVLALAIRRSNAYWVNKIHSELPRIIVDVSMQNYCNKGHIKFDIDLLSETEDAFDHTGSRCTSNSIYTKMMSYMKHLSSRTCDLNDYNILLELTYYLFNQLISIKNILDFDFLRFMFSSAYEMTNIIIDRLPICPHYDDSDMNYLCRTIIVNSKMFIKIEERFRERLSTYDETDIQRLRVFYMKKGLDSNTPLSVTLGYSKMNDCVRDMRYHMNEAVYTEYLAKLDRLIGSFLDNYLRFKKADR